MWEEPLSQSNHEEMPEKDKGVRHYEHHVLHYILIKQQLLIGSS